MLYIYIYALGENRIEWGIFRTPTRATTLILFLSFCDLMYLFIYLRTQKSDT